MKELTQINHNPGLALTRTISEIFCPGSDSEEATKANIEKAIWYLNYFINKLNTMED